MNTEPKILTITNRLASPVILTGPHNGWVAPKGFYKNNNPLGVAEHWFDPKSAERRHEACDWGVQDLFDVLSQKTKACLVSAHISRLIVDLNRIESVMVYESSSETGEPIPGNMHLDDAEKQKRLFTYYAPYFAALDKLIEETRAKYGYVIWLDIHSFTPTWQGKKREVGIGTLKMEKTPFTMQCEQCLEEEFRNLFVADHPYDLSLSPYREINAGGVIAERHNLDYFGIEIRNDLLETTKQIEQISESLIKLIATLENTAQAA